MSEITRITAVAFNKNGKDVSVSAKTPKNVIDNNYFSYCCQFHAVNIQLQVAESEFIRVQYEKLDRLAETVEEQLVIHAKHMTAAKEYKTACEKLRNNFISQISKDVLKMFETDNFAKAYTYMLMNVTSFTRAKSTTKGVKLEKVPAVMFDWEHYTESIEGANWKLSKAVVNLFDSATPKAVKQEVFKSFTSILNEMFGVETLNKQVYKLPNFNQIAMRLWSEYAQTIKKGNEKASGGISFDLKANESALYTLALTGLTHLHVLELASNANSKKEDELKNWASEFAKQLKTTKEQLKADKEETKTTK